MCEINFESLSSIWEKSYTFVVKSYLRVSLPQTAEIRTIPKSLPRSFQNNFKCLFFKRLYQIDEILKYKDQGLKVLGVAVNDEVSDAQKAIEDMGIEWPVIFDVQGTTLNIYGILGIPHLILFAPDGTIVSRGARGDGLKAVVDAAMSGR